MPNSFQISGKAAIFAAFFIFTGFRSALGATPTKTSAAKPAVKTDARLDEAKKKITSLLLLKQRTQALDILQELAKTTFNPESKLKLGQLKLVVLSSFLSPESQDFFEAASSQYLSQNKTALKNAQKCLSSDPDQFLCLWAEAKANSKSNSRYTWFLEKMKLSALDIPELKPLILSLDKTQPDFVNMKFDVNHKAELYDSTILSLILEFDRSIVAKNYLLAKESLDRLQQIAPDYIDIIMMRAQLYRRTYSEEAVDTLLNVITVYKKKCEAVSADVARKYFFDIDFCRRTLE